MQVKYRKDQINNKHNIIICSLHILERCSGRFTLAREANYMIPPDCANEIWLSPFKVLATAVGDINNLVKLHTN